MVRQLRSPNLSSHGESLATVPGKADLTRLDEIDVGVHLELDYWMRPVNYYKHHGWKFSGALPLESRGRSVLTRLLSRICILMRPKPNASRKEAEMAYTNQPFYGSYVSNPNEFESVQSHHIKVGKLVFLSYIIQPYNEIKPERFVVSRHMLPIVNPKMTREACRRLEGLHINESMASCG